jgi:hypothetical protein
MFADAELKLLLFTEHKDTLDYLMGKWRDWGLRVTQIHGGMKIGDRKKLGRTRISIASAGCRGRSGPSASGWNLGSES